MRIKITNIATYIIINEFSGDLDEFPFIMRKEMRIRYIYLKLIRYYYEK